MATPVDLPNHVQRKLRVTDASILQTDKLCKQYGDITVLNAVNFDLRGGEVHALIGANGAGKSTFCRMLAGLIRPSSGRMMVDGQPFEPRTKRGAELSGIEIVQQELNLVPTLTVAENLMLTRLPNWLGIIRRKALNAEARRLLDMVGLNSVSPETITGSLGIGQQQMIEIASALGRECRVLIMDEPTAALSHREVELLFEQIHRLRAEGKGIVYISHRLDEIKSLTDRVTILRDGQLVTTKPTPEVSTEQMIQLMSGTESTSKAASNRRSESVRGMAHSSKPALRVEKICFGVVRDVSFHVDEGEVLGITGLVGAGRTELLRAIFGADKAESGHVFIGDDPQGYHFGNPHEATTRGLALITEDRKESGVLLPVSIEQNSSLASLSQKFTRRGLIQFRDEQRAAADRIRQLNVRCGSGTQPVGQLSGGNQQKVVISKWLERDASVILFDEPTRGVDVAARRKIYDVIQELADSGKGIVMVSSDLDELFETCDRILVMSVGRVVRSFGRGDWSRDAIVEASFAGHRTSV
jgi:ribose transport system ATP-binding protein